MNRLAITLLCILFLTATYAKTWDENLLGKWRDKSNPTSHQWEFSKANEFTFTHFFSDGPRVTRGLWETGGWTNNKPDGTKENCSLLIYAGIDRCCFEYKFIGDQLILTIVDTSDEFSSMCQHRVLIEVH